MSDVSIEQLQARVRATHGPQFRLPKRFDQATFDNFITDNRFPGQIAAIESVTRLLETPEPDNSIFPWRGAKEQPVCRGVYLNGPPGIGKTHLLAAAFRSAREPKLFATFDEFSAAAGTLGMRELKRTLSEKRLVCVDEIDLRDPGNIMLLTSLVRAMLEGRATVLATANVDPTRMDAGHSYADQFTRELGEIASAFEIVEVTGVDWRENGSAGEMRSPRDRVAARVVQFDSESLLAFLTETHPMYDAAWLDEVDRIEIRRLVPMADTDEALRFVRFVDRVYDRDVTLAIDRIDGSLDDLLAPVKNDRRFQLHFARCRSRLLELVATGGTRVLSNERS